MNEELFEDINTELRRACDDIRRIKEVNHNLSEESQATVDRVYQSVMSARAELLNVWSKEFTSYVSR